MIKNKRIENLEFRPSSYLLPKDKWPKNPSYDIILWHPNSYYGRDEEFPEDPLDNSYRTDPKYWNYRIHKSCFKKPESCFTIASFDYDEHEHFYELHFCLDRPIEYLNTVEKREIFWKLLEYGNKQLNTNENEEES